MKKFIVLCVAYVTTVIVFALPPLSPPFPPTSPIQLIWTPAADADGYELRASQDLSISYTNWPVIGYVAGGSSTSFVFQAAPVRKMFYVCVASNFWGYAGPSNITNTPNTASNVTDLTLKR